jgi:transposase
MKRLPEVLAIDEFRGNAEGEKFQCILADPKNRRVVDILPTRKHEMIRHHLLGFNNRQDVRFVVMDMTGGYRKLMHELFPQAKIIVDKYHYVRQITYAIERIRIEEQKRLSDRWRRYFKKSKYLILKDSDKLTTEDRIQLGNLFRISPALEKAYALKQQFEYVKSSANREDAAKRLSKWIMDVQRSGLKEMIKVSRTYQNWSKEILNSFEYPYTNGYIEGCNNRIKVLKRVSFGMPRFARFRRRIMHIMLN